MQPGSRRANLEAHDARRPSASGRPSRGRRGLGPSQPDRGRRAAGCPPRSARRPPLDEGGLRAACPPPPPSSGLGQLARRGRRIWRADGPHDARHQEGASASWGQRRTHRAPLGLSLPPRTRGKSSLTGGQPAPARGASPTLRRAAPTRQAQKRRLTKLASFLRVAPCRLPGDGAGWFVQNSCSVLGAPGRKIRKGDWKGGG